MMTQRVSIVSLDTSIYARKREKDTTKSQFHKEIHMEKKIKYQIIKGDEVQDEGNVNKVSRKEQGKTIITGNFQLHHMDKSGLLGRNNKTLV